MNEWTNGPMNGPTNGPTNGSTNGPMDQMGDGRERPYRDPARRFGVNKVAHHEGAWLALGHALDAL